MTITITPLVAFWIATGLNTSFAGWFLWGAYRSRNGEALFAFFDDDRGAKALRIICGIQLQVAAMFGGMALFTLLGAIITMVTT